MRNVRRFITIGFIVVVGSIMALMVLGFVWISNPTHERLPLPGNLVSLESPEGKTLLEESQTRIDHESLVAHLQTQEKRSWCGVASAVTVLNSFDVRPQITQSGFFTDCVTNERSWLRTSFTGMTIDSFARMLQCHGVQARVVHAEASSFEEFRRVARENLKTKGNYVVVNYERSQVGQKPLGHVSPISAYHESSDRFLILDVATFKYPPVWVAASTLWAAMNTIDGESKHSRGYVLISAAMLAK
jgi:acetyl/propionyl-CoA carboxylase alpha subunit